MTMDFNTYYELTQLYADYASALSNNKWMQWPEFFLDECTYKLQPRENYDLDLPLATMAFESKGMLKDRVYGVMETLFHEPYYQRLVVGAPKVLGFDGDSIRAEANYAVFRTKPDQHSSVFNVGRYIDTVRRTPDGLKFESKICVFDSEMVPNALIYPI
jgi:salicylate 5-hydroxylase small subunit